MKITSKHTIGQAVEIFSRRQKRLEVNREPISRAFRRSSAFRAIKRDTRARLASLAAVIRGEIAPIVAARRIAEDYVSNGVTGALENRGPRSGMVSFGTVYGLGSVASNPRDI